MQSRLRTICLLASLLSTATLRAQQQTVALDIHQTKIEFTVHDVLHTVHGTFHAKEGHVVFDPATHTIKGEILVDAASGESGSEARDKRMAGNILEAQRYPEIRFTFKTLSGSVIPASASDVSVSGSFSIHGESHPLTIPVHLQIANEKITATGKFLIPYVQWGMKNPSTFLLKVSDEVEIEFTAVGHVKGSR